MFISRYGWMGLRSRPLDVVVVVKFPARREFSQIAQLSSAIFLQNLNSSLFLKRLSHATKPLNYLFLSEADVNSRFMRAMFSNEISTGQAAEQAPVLVHAPKPSASICATMLSARSLRSASPCGNNARWEILAETNSDAEAFLHAATQAPQPIQVAEANAASAFTLGTGMLLASGAEPVLAVM